MAWSAPSTRSTGDLIDATIWNQDVKANTEALRGGGIAIASQAAGDVVYASSATQYARLAVGTANKVLTSTGSAPQWSTQIVNAALPSNIDVGGTLDVSGATKLDGALEVSGHTFLDGTLSIGYLNSSLNKILIGGPYTSPGTSSYAQVVAMSTALTGVTGDTSWLVGVNIGPSITTQASETIADVASVVIDEPDITKGSGATVTRASTLFIRSAPTEATHNYGLFVKDCQSRFDGNIGVHIASDSPEAAIHTKDAGANIITGFDNVNDWSDKRWSFEMENLNSYSHAITSKMYYPGFEGSGSGTAIVMGREASSWNTFMVFCTNTGTGTEGQMQEKMRISSGGDVSISGALSKGSGSFRINHPHPEKQDHWLTYSFLEGPRCDLLTRGTVSLEAGSAVIDIDEATPQTAGTWALLCRSDSAQCFTSNETGFTAVRGAVTIVDGVSTLTIEAEDPTCTDVVAWMVVGERKDDVIKASSLTDIDGRLVVEPEKGDRVCCHGCGKPELDGYDHDAGCDCPEPSHMILVDSTGQPLASSIIGSPETIAAMLYWTDPEHGELSAGVSPAATVWASSDESIASIQVDGGSTQLSGHAVGSATITATYNGPHAEDVVATVIVLVREVE